MVYIRAKGAMYIMQMINGVHQGKRGHVIQAKGEWCTSGQKGPCILQQRGMMYITQKGPYISGQRTMEYTRAKGAMHIRAKGD